MQRADMKRRPPGPVDRVVLSSRALSQSLLLRCHLGFFSLDALRAVEHHLNHSVLHQWCETEQQASDEPDVDGLDVGHLGQLRSQGGALRGQGEHRQDAYKKREDKSERELDVKGNKTIEIVIFPLWIINLSLLYTSCNSILYGANPVFIKIHIYIIVTTWVL